MVLGIRFRPDPPPPPSPEGTGGRLPEKEFMNMKTNNWTNGNHEVVPANDRYTEAQAKLLPVGTTITFNRWAAQCYSTVYWRVARYVVTPKKKGGGNYLKLISSGYGSHPHIGGKYDPEWEGRVILG